MNPKTFELRNLFPTQRPEGVKCCSVCGKPDSSLTKAAKELPMHKRALSEDWAGKFRNLSRALGGAEKLMDLVTRKDFNAQLEWLRDVLTQAREEHDAMIVDEPVASDKARIKDALGKTLDLLGIKHGELKLVDLAEKLHEEVGILIALRDAG